MLMLVLVIDQVVVMVQVLKQVIQMGMTWNVSGKVAWVKVVGWDQSNVSLGQRLAVEVMSDVKVVEMSVDQIMFVLKDYWSWNGERDS